MTSCQFSRRAPFKNESRGLISALQNRQGAIAVSVSCAATSMAFFSAASPFSALAILAIPALIYPHAVNRLYLCFNRFCRQQGWSAPALLGLAFGIMIAAAFFVGQVPSANAAFYQNVENWLNTTVLKDQKDLVSLIVNVLRALFVVYIGIAVVSVVQKIQQQDDWQTAVRIPLVVVLAASMGDVLANLIIPAS